MPRIQSRPKELNPVFMTLIDNALEAMAGGGRSWVRAAATDRDIRVEGRHRSGNSTVRAGRPLRVSIQGKEGRVSVGLGRPTAPPIVKGHGGKLEVRSTLGGGTTFADILPLVTGGEPARRP